MTDNNYSELLKKLLGKVVEEKASDLIISNGHYPTLRITGQLIPLVKEEK